MRRIASVFKRNDSKRKHDPPPSAQPALADPNARQPPSQPATRSNTVSSKKGRFLASITVSTDPPPVPPLDQNHSSASSTASASCSLQTPDDERGSHLNVPTVAASQQMPRKPSWLPWHSNRTPHVVSPTHSSPSPPLHWPESAASNTTASFAPRYVPQSVESEGETSDESSSDEDAPLAARTSQSFRQQERMLIPTEYFAALTVSKSVPTLSQSPLLHVPDAPLFPRSSNSASSLSLDSSLEVSMHRRRLLSHLQKHEFSPADRHMLQAFGSRPARSAESRLRPQPEEGARCDLKRVLPHSRGLRRWISRAYFEERMALWTPEPTSGTVTMSAVKGSGYGVLALEVSESLELLAGFDDASATTEPDVTPSLAFSAAASTGSVLGSVQTTTDRPLLPRPAPSPLRNQSDVKSAPIITSVSSPISPSSLAPSPSRSPSLPTLPPSSSTATFMSTSSGTTVMPTPSVAPSELTISAAPKREVRFTAGSAKEDKVPKDYVLRIQRNREEKARFLREEQQRREYEVERLRHEQERRQWEEEKRQWEREKRTMEEERKRKAYADELVAARNRRETSNKLPYQVPADLREAYNRPTYDRRESINGGNVPASRPREGSSGSSSNPNSAPRTPTDSRPPSMYSTHSTSSVDEAARSREARKSRRASHMSDSPSLMSANMAAYGWPAMPAIPPMPQMMPNPYAVPVVPVPMIPQFAALPMMDMPLLPPNAPFMMHGNGSRSRTPSRTSGSSSSRNASPARGGLPGNGSTERLGASVGTNRGRTHQRNASGDSGKRSEATHVSQTGTRARGASSSSTTNSARGRSGVATQTHSAHAPIGHSSRPPMLAAQNSWGTLPRTQHAPPLAPRRSTAFA